MTRISKYPLEKDLEKEMFNLFWSSISDLHSSLDASLFFKDLLSETEEMMLAKRFAVAILLSQGKRPVAIASVLHVSFSAIQSVSQWLSRASAPTRRVLAGVEEKQAWRSVWDKLEAVFDTLPPRYGSNWSKTGKEKFVRRTGRQSRARLRGSY